MSEIMIHGHEVMLDQKWLMYDFDVGTADRGEPLSPLKATTIVRVCGVNAENSTLRLMRPDGTEFISDDPEGADHEWFIAPIAAPEGASHE